MTQRIISIDSQVLNSVQACARKTEYSFSKNLQPIEKAEALERGDLLHKMLEIYYGLLLGNLTVDKGQHSETWKALVENQLIQGIPIDPLGPSEARDFTLKQALFFSSKLSLDPDHCDEVIYQFQEYCEFYKNDFWSPLAVEEVGSKILYEDEELKIIYNFKIDLIAQKGMTIVPWDHKTSRRASFLSSMSNQFMGYCWGLGLNNVIINKIGFQKTLAPNQRFQRPMLSYTDARLEEWVENSVYWMKILDHHQQINHWPMNLTSCDKYSGCIYESVCSKDVDSREIALERDFTVGKRWDVAEILESK